VAEAITQAAPCPVQWVRSAAGFADVRNHYRHPAEQGADRWLAVLAARQLCADDVVVACAGTALTVEALTAEGDYLGGLILPGQALMLRSLAQGTAQLDRLAGSVQTFRKGPKMHWPAVCWPRSAGPSSACAGSWPARPVAPSRSAADRRRCGLHCCATRRTGDDRG
jgi:hypothetical protein